MRDAKEFEWAAAAGLCSPSLSSLAKDKGA